MEIERKFLIGRFPEIEPFESAVIYQGYISINPEVRIRSYEVTAGEDVGRKDYKISVKGEGTLSREEIETFVTEEFFNEMVKFIGKPLIRKEYSTFFYNGHVLECSHVDCDSKQAFFYGEVEFESEDDAHGYQWPFGDAKDVTYDDSYKMKNYWCDTRCNQNRELDVSDFKIGQKVGAIWRSRNGEHETFKLIVSKVSNVSIGKTKTTVSTSPKIFRSPLEMDEFWDARKPNKNGLIVVDTPLLLSDEMEKHLKKLVDKWNTEGYKSLWD